MTVNFDVIACGDLLTNYVYIGTNDAGISIYERHPAGTTSNLLAQVAKLGGKAALISTLGNDEDGKFLYEYAKKAGIDVTNVYIKDGLFTRTVFVYFKNNDRYFSYNGSDRSHFETDLKNVDQSVVDHTKVFVFPLNHLQTTRPIHETVCQLLKRAKENHVLLAVDANYRGQYIPENELLLMRQAIKTANILKMTKREMEYYIGEADLMKGTDKILGTDTDTKIVAITLDKDGCFIRTRKYHVYRPTIQVDVLDTTGAGDSFMGSLLYQLSRENCLIDELTEKELVRIADFSNICASISTTKRGSLDVMTSMQEIRESLSCRR